MKMLKDVKDNAHNACDKLREAQESALHDGLAELAEKLGGAAHALDILAVSIVDLETAIRLRTELNNRTTTSKESQKVTTETRTSTKTEG